MITKAPKIIIALALASHFIVSPGIADEPAPARPKTETPPAVETKNAEVRGDLVQHVVDDITVARLRRELLDARVQSLRANKAVDGRGRVMFPPH